MADRLLSIAESLGFWFAFLHCKLSLLFPRLVDWCRFSTLGAQETHSIDSIARCLGVFAFLPTTKNILRTHPFHFVLTSFDHRRSLKFWVSRLAFLSTHANFVLSRLNLKVVSCLVLLSSCCVLSRLNLKVVSCLVFTFVECPEHLQFVGHCWLKL